MVAITKRFGSDVVHNVTATMDSRLVKIMERKADILTCNTLLLTFTLCFVFVSWEIYFKQ